jgi:hypothetical protein
MKWVLLASAVLFAPAANAQFQVFLVDGPNERAAPPIIPLGAVSANESLTSKFRIRNVSGGPALLTYLAVSGSSFALTSGPFLPATLAPQAGFDFTVSFSGSDIGAYSASLRADGISLLLTATVTPGLTFIVESIEGKQVLGNAAIDFGAVEVGQTATLHFIIENRTNLLLTAPAIVIAGSDFSLQGIPGTGMALGPGAATGFDVTFRPAAAGLRSGTLIMGSHSYALAGNAAAPVLPHPSLSIDLRQQSSAQQGSVSVHLSEASKAAATGTLTLDFRPSIANASDATVAFASGGRSLSFTVSPGDTQARFGTQTTALFQTGTTTGSLVLTVQLGGFADQQTVQIPPAAVTVTSARAVRGGGSVEVQIAGFDNTRSAGTLSFRFFDAAGTPIAPGTISADAGSLFASYFQGSSDVGGAFLLRAVFPVTGEPSRLASFETTITNSAGPVITARTSF